MLNLYTSLINLLFLQLNTIAVTILIMDGPNWSGVVEEIGPRLYRYFKYKGANDFASDLTQETFIRLMGKRHLYDPGQGPLVAYALGIAQNVWRENLRKRQITFNIEEHNNILFTADLHEQLEKADQSEKLKLIVNRMSQVQQDILYFYFDEEITTREIATTLNMPEGTIKSHLHRAKETLREILEKEWL